MNEIQPIEPPTPIQKIFKKRYFDRLDLLSKNGDKFVHYTSADTALEIIRNQEFWMRNARFMIDFSEVDHGFQMLNTFFGDPDNKKDFTHALNAITDDIGQDTFHKFYNVGEYIRERTFITCFSEHGKDEEYGRLSMWRAYGNTDVTLALVLHPRAIYRTTDALRVNFNPVYYLNPNEYNRHMSEFLYQLKRNKAVLRSLSAIELENNIWDFLLFTASSFKHPGFSEEREWRAIYVPGIHSDESLTSTVETIGGISQNVNKVPLKFDPDKSLRETEIGEVIEKIIIGPTNFSQQAYSAIVEELLKAGVHDAASRVIVSGIPMRT